jgi:hypothetical protein
MISGLPAVSAHRRARHRRTDFQRLRYAKHILWLAIVVSFWKESFNGDGKPLHPISTNPTTTSYLKSLNHYIQYQQTQQPPLTSNHWTITSNINKPNNHLSPQITEPLHPISTNPTTTSYLKSLNKAKMTHCTKSSKQQENSLC